MSSSYYLYEMEFSYLGGSLLDITVVFTGLFIIFWGKKSTNMDYVQGQVSPDPVEGHKRFITQIIYYLPSSMDC